MRENRLAIKVTCKCNKIVVIAAILPDEGMGEDWQKSLADYAKQGLKLDIVYKDFDQLKLDTCECKPEKADPKVFDNQKRLRYYGLRVGDLVSIPDEVDYFKVHQLVPLDNNAVILKHNDGSLMRAVAEWCTVIREVEED